MTGPSLRKRCINQKRCTAALALIRHNNFCADVMNKMEPQ
jgi:hypothetical protein